MKKNLELLEKLLKIRFKDKNLLSKSVIHKSFDKFINNEKLEFLGDRVLGLVISKRLLEIYPNESEGSIDKKFANLVNKRTCAAIAEKLEIKDFMKLGASSRKLKRSDEKILSDCLEAIVGALFLDTDLKTVEKFVLKHWQDYLTKSENTIIDSKTRLQEFCLKKYKKLPKYNLNKRSGPQHSPSFKVEVEIPNFKKMSGSGNSIKKAQQNAASKLLKNLNIL
jgi:ribonuclease-3